MTARIVAIFVGGLTLVNLAGNALWPGFDGNGWWIHLGTWLPAGVSEPLLLLSALLFLRFAFLNPERTRRLAATTALALFLAAVALANTICFYWLVLTSRLKAGIPIPLSLFICAGMLLIARAAWLRRPTVFNTGRWAVLLGGSSRSPFSHWR